MTESYIHFAMSLRSFALHFTMTVSLGRHHVSSNREHALTLAARRRHSKNDPDKVGEQWELFLVSLPPAQLVNIYRSIWESLVAVALLPELGNHWR